MSEYETVLFYAHRAARSNCVNNSPYSCIIAVTAKLPAAGKGRPLQLEHQAVDVWIAAVRDPEPDPSLRL